MHLDFLAKAGGIVKYVSWQIFHVLGTHKYLYMYTEERERCVKPGHQGKERELDGGATMHWGQ